MEQEDLTLSDWYSTLRKRLVGAPREASRFYNLQLLPRLMYALYIQKRSCLDCENYFDKLNSNTLQLTEWFKNEGEELKEYQTLIESIIKHLQAKHGIVAKGLWLSRIVVVGLMMGAVVAYLLYLWLPEAEKSGLIILGSVIGMMVGWIGGKIYESQLRKKNRIF